MVSRIRQLKLMIDHLGRLQSYETLATDDKQHYMTTVAIVCSPGSLFT